MPQELVEQLDGTYKCVQVCRCHYLSGAHAPGCPHFLGKLNVRHWVSRAECDAFRDARVWKLAFEGICNNTELHEIAWEQFADLMSNDGLSHEDNLRRGRVMEILLEPFK